MKTLFNYLSNNDKPINESSKNPNLSKKTTYEEFKNILLDLGYTEIGSFDYESHIAGLQVFKYKTSNRHQLEFVSFDKSGFPDYQFIYLANKNIDEKQIFVLIFISSKIDEVIVTHLPDDFRKSKWKMLEDIQEINLSQFKEYLFNNTKIPY